MNPLEVTPTVATALEQAARPLLQLAQRITALESTCVTVIDWDEQTQEILVALNSGELRMREGTTMAWGDSLSRQLLLSGRTHCSAIGSELAATRVSMELGIQTFAAVPIMHGDAMIGMVCGASSDAVAMDEFQAEGLQLIADALQQLLDARLEAARHAADSRRMKKLAHTDSLTGLPNRRAFIARWEDELARSSRRLHPIGLMFIDADRFKAVNDTLGHEAGDALLRGIGATLQQVAGPDDLLARLGGDEFAMATMHKSSAEMANIAADIQARFERVASDLGVDATLSIGIAHSDSSPRDQLLVEADRSMYRSKFGRDLAA
jgi:diguanylate cyclase